MVERTPGRVNFNRIRVNGALQNSRLHWAGRHPETGRMGWQRRHRNAPEYLKKTFSPPTTALSFTPTRTAVRGSPAMPRQAAIES